MVVHEIGPHCHARMDVSPLAWTAATFMLVRGTSVRQGSLKSLPARVSPGMAKRNHLGLFINMMRNPNGGCMKCCNHKDYR
jgi:hypothetical protein